MSQPKAAAQNFSFLLPAKRHYLVFPDMSLFKRLSPRLFILVLLVTFIVSIAPTISRTIAWASNGPDLSLHAYLSDEADSYNPWRSDTVLMSGDFAVWILENFDWPYQNRTSAQPFNFSPPQYGARPYVYLAYAGRSYNPDFALQDRRAARILKAFLEHGEPVDEWYGGGTTLQWAVMAGDDEFAKMLLEYGADPFARIRNERLRFYDMNSFEVAESLYLESGASYAPTYQQVMSVRPDG